MRSFFAEALASMYVVSGQKADDQAARDLEDRMPTARSDAERLGDVGGGAAGLDGVQAGGTGTGTAAGEGDMAELRPSRVRRFRS